MKFKKSNVQKESKCESSDPMNEAKSHKICFSCSKKQIIKNKTPLKPYSNLQ
jgi:hypothetical protein